MATLLSKKGRPRLDDCIREGWAYNQSYGHDSCVSASHTGFLSQLIQTRAAQWSRHKARQSQPYSAGTNEELKPQQNLPVRCRFLEMGELEPESILAWYSKNPTVMPYREEYLICTKGIPSLISPPVLKLLKDKHSPPIYHLLKLLLLFPGASKSFLYIIFYI